jgi:hypothetical protein
MVDGHVRAFGGLGEGVVAVEVLLNDPFVLVVPFEIWDSEGLKV